MIKIFGDEYKCYGKDTNVYTRPSQKEGGESMSIKKVTKKKALSCKCHQSC